VLALLGEKTGDGSAKANAFRSFNWATYMTRANGRVIDFPPEGSGGNEIWWTDGYGDYIRHFLAGMSIHLDWAPNGEAHLLRSTSLVKSIAYHTGTIAYTTHDANAIETFKLAARPEAVTAGGAEIPQLTNLEQEGWTYDATNGALRIRHERSNQVQITCSAGKCGSAAPPPETPAPPTPAPVLPITVTFDNLTTVGQPLNGIYPPGMIDWGSGKWHLSGPWAGFNTNSISFANEGSTSAELRLIHPKLLVRVSATTHTSGDITLSCDGLPDVHAVFAGTQVIETGWTASCLNLIVSASNGWETNFDTFVFRDAPPNWPNRLHVPVTVRSGS
jgi:hypothetical protein